MVFGLNGDRFEWWSVEMVDGVEMIRWYLILQCKVLIELLANMHHHNNHNNPMNPKNHSSDNFPAQVLSSTYYVKITENNQAIQTGKFIKM